MGSCGRRKRSTVPCKVLRIATITALASSAPSLPLHSATATVLLPIALLLALPPTGESFSPAPVGKQSGIGDNRLGRVRENDTRQPNRHSSWLYATSKDDTSVDGDSANEFSNERVEPIVNDINGNGGSSVEDEEDDGTEVDVIAQKLRRNAESPINSMKEHDKMREDNELEANLSSASDRSLEVNAGSNNTQSNSLASVLYSYMMANDFDPFQSSDEEYKENQLKDLLSRKGKELARLGPGIATLPLDPSSAEFRAEETLAKKESALQQVIDEARAVGAKDTKDGPQSLEESQREQSEIFARAAKLQSEIDALHLDDCGSVLLANLAFYEAFSLQDEELMKDVWWASPNVACVHPSHAALIGSNAVVGSFARMFANGRKGARARGGESASAGSMGAYMSPTNIRGLSVRGTSASLVCDEEVYCQGSGGGGDGARKGSGPLVNKLLTTNQFRKIGGKWKMVHRHASWHPETTAAKEAMKAEPGIVLYDESEGRGSSDGSANNGGLKGARQGMALRRLNGDGTSKRPASGPSVPSSLDGLNADAVLGVPKPKEEKPAKASGGDSVDGMIGKIINLSDLLGGKDDDDDAGDDDGKAGGIGEMLADLLGGSADSDNTSVSGSGTPDDPFVTRRIIKIGPQGIENLSGKNKKNTGKNEADDNNGGENGKEVVIDLRDKSEEERKEVLSKLGIPSNVLDVPTTAKEEGGEGKDLRQKCIATLRKLSADGSISSRQKRVLLTDIITSSARGEMSMVEVAYELLCSDENGAEKDGAAGIDTGMEDFMEQCRVFASMGEEGGH